MPEENKFPNKIYEMIATGLYSGYTPFVPGTIGSFLFIAILWFLPTIDFWKLLITTVIIFTIGLKSSSELVPFWGKDPGKINIDEIAGMAVALLGLPKTLIVWVSAFFSFHVVRYT